MSYKAESWFLLFLLAFIWGSSFILIKQGLAAFTPFQVAALRIGFAALCLLPVAVLNFRKVSFKEYKHIAAFGLCNAGLPAFLFATAQTKVNSSTAGILNALTPIFTLLVGVFLYNVKLTARKITGVIIGFIGAALLVFFSKGFTVNPFADSDFFYTMLIVIATILYGFSGNIMKDKLQNVPGHIISSFAYLIFAIPLLAFMLFTDFSKFETANTLNEMVKLGSLELNIPQGYLSLLFLVILGFFGSAIAIVLFSRLVKHSNALFGSFTTYLLPFVAILWGVFIGEDISVIALISLAIILFGIFITTIPRRQTKKP